MESTQSKVKNKDLETCKNFLQIGIFKFVMGYIDIFTLRVKN